MTHHTPGPWVYTNGSIWKDGYNAVKSSRICTFRQAATPVRQITDSEQEANARLIAVVPELLEVAQQFVGWLDKCGAKPTGFESRLYKKFQSVIAKATNRQHVLYETGDEDSYDAIEDEDGDVVLEKCRVCGQAEVDLEPECPGPQSAPDTSERAEETQTLLMGHASIASHKTQPQ